MAISDMELFNSQIQVVATETVDQAVAKFNEASGGALIMGGSEQIGDYIEEASYSVIGSLASRRDAYATGALTDLDIAQMLDVAVKVDGTIGPVVWDLEQFRRLGKSEEEAGLIIGEQAASAMMQDYLNTFCAAMVAATTTNAALTYDGTAGVASLSSLNSGAALFGDRSQSLVAWMMHSKAYHDLVGEAITNSNRLFNIGNISVMEDGLGRRYVVTDSPNLITAGAPDVYHTLGLVQGAGIVQVGNLVSVIDDITGQNNLGKRLQGEYNFTLGLKGYAWDKTNGGASPSNVALATGTNWDQIATSDKDCAGVMVNTD